MSKSIEDATEEFTDALETLIHKKIKGFTTAEKIDCINAGINLLQTLADEIEDDTQADLEAEDEDFDDDEDEGEDSDDDTEGGETDELGGVK